MHITYQNPQNLCFLSEIGSLGEQEGKMIIWSHMSRWNDHITFLFVCHIYFIASHKQRLYKKVSI